MSPRLKLAERCGRCPREELVEVTLEEAVQRVKAPSPKHKALTIALDGEPLVSYDYLCEECRGIVTAYCHGTRPQQKRSARRFKREPTIREDKPRRARVP